jgi:hypothetical protein
MLSALFHPEGNRNMHCGAILCLYLLIASSALAETKNYAIFYLDKTASMQGTVSDGGTRCDASKRIAKVSVRNFFEKWNGQAIDIRTFSQPGQSISLTQGFTDIKAAALSAIDDSPCDGSSTALADAICEGADRLREEFSAVAADSETFLMLVAATDGEENSSAGPCGGSDWRAKVEDKIRNTSPAIRLNMSVFGELQKIATGTAGNSSMATDSLSYFSRLSAESGGTAIFINDYAKQLPDFMPLFPNDEQYIGRLKAANIQVEPWQDATDAEAIGFSGLKLDARSLRRTELDIEAIMRSRGASPIGQSPAAGLPPVDPLFPPIRGPGPIVTPPLGIDPRRDPPIVPGVTPSPMRPPLLSGPGWVDPARPDHSRPLAVFPPARSSHLGNASDGQ